MRLPLLPVSLLDIYYIMQLAVRTRVLRLFSNLNFYFPFTPTPLAAAAATMTTMCCSDRVLIEEREMNFPENRGFENFIVCLGLS